MKYIEIKNISFSYDEKNVFKDYFARFPAGKTSIIMSPSGSGKTTLLYLIAGLLEASKGDIKYPFEKPKFSFVFQEDRLIENMSIINNIKMINPKLNLDEIMECLERLGLKEDCKKKVANLSGGEKRRVSIARAILAKYDILLLDEPFTGIDDENKVNVIAYIKKRTSGKTVIAVTHNKQEAFLLGDTEAKITL